MTTFTARALNIADALANVLPHTDGGSALPVLESVQVTVEADGLVTVAGTDRYTLAFQEVVSGPPNVDIVPGVFLLDRKDAVDVVKMAKAAKTDWLAFVHDGVDLTVTAPGTSLTRRTVDGDFPKWRSLLPDGDPVPVDMIGLGSEHLAKFAKLQRDGRTVKNATLVCTFRSRTKPMDVRATEIEDFRAIVMPVRLPEAK